MHKKRTALIECYVPGSEIPRVGLKLAERSRNARESLSREAGRFPIRKTQADTSVSAKIA